MKIKSINLEIHLKDDIHFSIGSIIHKKKAWNVDVRVSSRFFDQYVLEILNRSITSHHCFTNNLYYNLPIFVRR